MNKWIIFDVMGVVFTVGDDTNDLLVPFVQERNRLIDKEKINMEYMHASLGKITSNEFWRKMGVCHLGEEQKICKTYLDACLTLDSSFIQTAKYLKKNII